ncbi:hypothetical protein [Clostridium ihumii]|uniref:hypothetical protein n=1 Tax=Clostridium ihumii TaxID=1470356 RepID=UPI00058D5F57|nr:hypothetical protein [Clostridium ihumii]
MSIDAVNEKITLKAMTNWVKERNEKYSFVEDSIDFSEDIPLSNDEYNKFIKSINSLSDDDICNVSDLMKIYNKIPNEHVLIDALSQYEALFKDNEIVNIIGKVPLHKYSYEQLVKAKENIEILKSNISKFKNNGFEKVLYCVDNNKYFHDITKNVCSKLEFMVKEAWILTNNVYFKNIEIPDNIDLLKLKCDFDIFLKSNSTIKFKKIIFKLKNTFKYSVLKKCKVNGINLCEGADINSVYDYINLKILENEILSIWNNYANKCDLKKLNKIDIESITFIEGELKYLKEIIKFNENYRTFLISDFREYVCEDLPLDQISKIKSLLLLDKLVMIQLLEKYLCKLKRLFFSCRCTEKLCIYMDNYEYDKIKNHYNYLNELKDKKDQVKTHNILQKKLKKTMPKFYENIKRNKTRFIGLDFEELFKYTKFNGVLNGKIKSNKYSDLLKIEQCC